MALAAVTLAGTVGLPGSGATSQAAPGGGAGLTAQTDASVPARAVTMLGATPLEPGAPGANETWGLGQGGVLVRYTTQAGWSLGPGLVDHSGAPLSGFELDASPLAGQMTTRGHGVLVGAAGGKQVVLTRRTGGPFQETEPVPTPADLEPGERLFAATRAPMIAPLEEAAGAAGALVVPYSETGVERWVLHWSGTAWTREPIEVPAPSSGEFRVLAIGASSPSNAWLLARLSSPAGALTLFRRHPGEGAEEASWRPAVTAPGGAPGEPLAVPTSGGKAAPFAVPGDEGHEQIQGQLLTVTSDGLWLDGERPDVSAPTTMYLKIAGESALASTSWCNAEGAGAAACDEALPEELPAGELPAGSYRSVAWANPATPFGERVITGLTDGASLRLEGRTFSKVLALGGSGHPGANPGAAFGAAFSSPLEGWLGQEALPVHLTLNRVASRLAPWPVAFRFPLLAVAPQPGAPVGAISSQALAVGDRGQVARYVPEKGWLPESLIGTGGRHAAPRLRAVAWPTPSRAYAVGDEGQMWLWRGETGLWEPDPATPANFQGNLLGIAFDPNNSSRGYAVGEGAVEHQGVLLSFGKSWTQQPAEALPAEVAGANFTSVAFAGSEAIVAYRKLLNPSDSSSYVGGVLVNSGSGWHVDAGAAAAMGRAVPWAVAGLPDGGAAFVASGHVYERQSAGAPWQVSQTALPGAGTPGAIALFREAGALRAVVSGSEPFTFEEEDTPLPPPGSPPNKLNPYPIKSDPEKGVLRQTAGGWSDEEHELNNIREPPGSYKFYDTVYQPDPISAVLIDPSGSSGWAVGGFLEPEAHGGVLDTADIARYPADGVAPPGVGASPIPLESAFPASAGVAPATFAIGGGAACAAPCAHRAGAGIGPDVWLSHAIGSAAQVSGVRGFLYTGPRLASRREVSGAPPPFPYPRELAQYAQLLASGPPTLPAFAASSPTDLDEAEGEGLYEAAFSGFPAPFGVGPQRGGFAAAGAAGSGCGAQAGCQKAYAMDSTGSGGNVRVIFLDDSGAVGPGELGWLAAQLSEVANREPAIVVGNADLSAQIAAGDERALAVARTLGAGHASAYFFDAREQNVQRPLLGAPSVPSFGSGTLGYVSATSEGTGGFIGASGFLLVQVDAERGARTAGGQWPVKVALIPNIGELGMEAQEGTLLRRSQAARFSGLARRPRSGSRAQNAGAGQLETDPYIPIPSICTQASCANGLLPEYSFSSSKPGVGRFVKENALSGERNGVLLGPTGEPIPDPHSGLFCALNKGTTTVTISAGGLSASLQVTVQAGSVRRPCGTTRSEEAVTPEQHVQTPSQTPPSTTPATSGTPTSVLTVLPPAPVITPASPPPHPRPPAPETPFFVQPGLAVLIPAFVPPPLPAPANPTPPSGTSAVTSPVEAAQKEEEEEEATESVSNQAVAYRTSEHEPMGAYILGIVLLAAFAGAAAVRRPRRGGREVRVAPATISAMRSQRRLERRRRW